VRLLVPLAGGLRCSWHRRERVERLDQVALAVAGSAVTSSPLRFGLLEVAAGVLLPR
jgi:hypothetical protein